MSWTTPKVENLEPIPGGKPGGERQDSNEGLSNDARNADTEEDVELPSLLEEFEKEENTLSEDNKTLVITQVLEVQNPEVCLMVHPDLPRALFPQESLRLWFLLILQFRGRFWFLFLQWA